MKSRLHFNRLCLVCTTLGETGALKSDTRRGGDGNEVCIARVGRDVDTIAWREERVETLNELGVASEQLRDAVDDTWRVNAAVTSE